MYAVIETGGKQYRVAPGDFVQIEKIEGEKGVKVPFDKVLFVAKPALSEEAAPQVWIGKPHLAGAQVEGEIVAQGRDKKLLIIKMRRRKQYRRMQGHRQWQTQLLITRVDNGSGLSATLSDSDHQTKLKSFFSNLKPMGEGFTAPILKRRKTAVKANKKD